MAVKIRLQRFGSKHSPVYRMVIADARARRDGRSIETIGIYNPKARGAEKEINLKIDRIDHWLNEGAQPTDTARSLIKKARKILLNPEFAENKEAKSNAKVAEPVAEAISEKVEETAPAATAEAEPVAQEEKSTEPVAVENKIEESAQETVAEPKNSTEVKEDAEEKAVEEKSQPDAESSTSEDEKK